MADEGEVRRFLGLSISRDRQKQNTTISQKQYMLDILTKFGMENCTPMSTPMEAGLKLSLHKERSEEEATQRPCREIIGSTMFLMLNSRPDLSVAISLSRFQNGAMTERLNILIII